MQQLGDPVDGRPSRRERTVRRPEGGVGSIDANLGTRATRTGRQAGREGQATGDLPLPPPSALASGVIDGMLIGVLVWAIVVLTLLPALGASVAALFPTLLGALCAGGVVGPGVQAALRAGRSRRLPVAAPAGPGRRSPGDRRGGPPVDRWRIVILGGGFGGVSAAKRFEQLLPWTPWLDVTLVSQRNYLLFTPMLAEVAAGSVEAGNVGVPLRAACPRTRFRRAEVLGVDPERKVVHLRRGDALETLPYDHLVLALGAMPNFRNLPGVAASAHTLATLEDARRLRRHRGRGQPLRPGPQCAALLPQRQGQRAPLPAGPLPRPDPARAGRPAGRLRQRQAGRPRDRAAARGHGGRRRRRRGRAQRRPAGGGPHLGLGRRDPPQPHPGGRAGGVKEGRPRAGGGAGRPGPAGAGARRHLGRRGLRPRPRPGPPGGHLPADGPARDPPGKGGGRQRGRRPDRRRPRAVPVPRPRVPGPPRPPERRR